MSNIIVMDAHIWTPKIDPVGWLISEKLDGVRGYWTGTEFISHRVGNAFRPPPEFIANFPPFALDGEFWIKRGAFQITESAVVTRSSFSPLWKEIYYMLFDVPNAPGGLMNRYQMAKNWFKDHPNSHVRFVEQIPCTSRAQLKAMLDEVIKHDGEGLMLHQPNAPYERKRSHTLLKVKVAQDAEAELVDYTTGTGRNASCVGAFMLKRPDGVIFKCGAGLTDLLRTHPPPKGTIITYKYDGLASLGKPRNPRFLRISKEKNIANGSELKGLKQLPLAIQASPEKVIPSEIILSHVDQSVKAVKPKEPEVKPKSHWDEIWGDSPKQ